MKLIIDIPEEIYNSACAINNTWNMRMAGFVCSAIANGTPLDDLKKEIDKESVMHMDGEIYVRNIDVKRILEKTETR